MQDVENLKPSDALCCFRFSDMGLLEGEWPVLGQSRPWEPELWPIPTFVRREILSKTPEALVQYEEDMLHSTEFPVDDQDVSGLPKDGLLGDKAVEIALSMEFGWTEAE